MKKVKVLAVLLCLVLLFGTAACGGSTKGEGETSVVGGSSSPTAGGSQSTATGGSSSPEAGGSSSPAGNTVETPVRDSLSIAVRGDIGTLNPASIGTDFLSIAHCIQEPLWTVRKLSDGTRDVIMYLATSIDEVSEEMWVIHLRENVYFSNGNKFTASDVLFSAIAAREAGTTGIARTQEWDVERSRALDDYTIEIYFEHYRHNLMDIYSDLLIYDEESYSTESASSNPIGTGPYALKEYVVNSHVFLESRDDYWGNPPAVRNLNFRVLAEPSQVVNALATNNIDIGVISTQDISFVSGLPGYKVLERLPARWLTIGMNPTPDMSPFHNIEARYAVAHAIDKQAIVDIVFDGYAEVALGPTTRAAWDWVPEFENMHETYSIGYNLDLARQYAESSGLAGQEIRIITNGTAEFVQTAEIIQSMLQKIDVTVLIQNYDAAGYSDAARDPSMWEMSIGVGTAPTLQYGGAIANVIRMSPIYSAPGSWYGVDRWMEFSPNVFYEGDPVKRYDITMELVELYTTACLVYSICEYLQFTAVPENLEGVTYAQNGTILYKLLSFS